MSKKPVRQEPLATQPISREVQAQIEAHKRRKAAARPKATYDLPPHILDAVASISDRESVARSDIVAYALHRFIDDYRAGDVDLEPHKERTRSLRYEWKLKPPE